MIKWILRRAIDKFEREWKYDASYMRDIIDASPVPRGCFRALWRSDGFGVIFPAAVVRRRHYRRAPRGLRPLHSAERRDGRAGRRQPCGFARGACGQPRRHAAGRRAGMEIHARDSRARCCGGCVSGRDRETVGTARSYQFGFRNHRRANLSNRQVRPRPRQGLYAHCCWRHAGGARSRPSSSASGCGDAYAMSMAGTMSNPAESFEPFRRRLLGLAYRMLGSMADAEDAVQETYLRWHAAERGKVSDAKAFLMTTTARICIDMLTSARAGARNMLVPGCRSRLSTRQRSRPTGARSWPRICR